MSYQRVLDGAIKAAAVKGFTAITRKDIAEAAGCSLGLVSHHLKDMDTARGLTLEYACAHRILNIVAQGLSIKHPTTSKLPREEKIAAASSLLEE